MPLATPSPRWPLTKAGTRRLHGACPQAEGDTAQGERGIFCFENSTGAAEVKRADIGANAYVADDHTVAKTGSSIAGEIVDLDDMGVWVHVGVAAVPTTA